MNAERKNRAIYCNHAHSAHFDDIGLSGNCTEDTESCADSFGATYTNDTEFGGDPFRSTFFTDSEHFKVKEVEVFKITDGTNLPTNPVCLHVRKGARL